MAIIDFDKLWRSEIYENVSEKDRVQDVELYQIKVKVKDSYRKDETITTKFEPSIDEDVVDKSYLDTDIFKSEGH